MVRPDPGTDAAVALGCRCPQEQPEDHWHGQRLFTIERTCPLHGAPIRYNWLGGFASDE